MKTMSKKRRKPKPASPSTPTMWSRKLRALRDSLGSGGKPLSQAKTAKTAGIPTRTWISWENAQYTPSAMAQRILLEAFPQLASL